MRRLRRTAHVTVIALPLCLTLVATLPLAGGLLWSGVEIRQVTLEGALGRFRRLIELVDLELDARISSISGLIVAVATDFGSDRLTAETAACSNRLQQLAGLVDSLDTIFVINLQGSVICSSRTIPAGINIADRGYFRLALESSSLVVDTPVRSRITGRPTIPVSIALRDGENRIVGVLAATIDVLRLLDQAATRSGIPQASLGLWDESAELIARMPALPPLLMTAMTAAERPLLTREGDEARPLGPAAIQVEGQQRVFIADFLSFGDKRLLISADVPAAELYHEVDDIFRRSLLGAGSLTLLSLALAGLIYAYAERRLLRQLVERLPALVADGRPAPLPIGLGLGASPNLLDELNRSAQAPHHAPPWAG